MKRRKWSIKFDTTLGDKLLWYSRKRERDEDFDMFVRELTSMDDESKLIGTPEFAIRLCDIFSITKD